MSCFIFSCCSGVSRRRIASRWSVRAWSDEACRSDTALTWAATDLLVDARRVHQPPRARSGRSPGRRAAGWPASDRRPGASSAGPPGPRSGPARPGSPRGRAAPRRAAPDRAPAPPPPATAPATTRAPATANSCTRMFVVPPRTVRPAPRPRVEPTASGPSSRIGPPPRSRKLTARSPGRTSKSASQPPGGRPGRGDPRRRPGAVRGDHERGPAPSGHRASPSSVSR